MCCIELSLSGCLQLIKQSLSGQMPKNDHVVDVMVLVKNLFFIRKKMFN